MTDRSLVQEVRAWEQKHAGHTIFVNSYHGGRKEMQLNQIRVDCNYGNEESTLRGKSMLKHYSCSLNENSSVTAFVSCKC